MALQGQDWDLTAAARAGVRKFVRREALRHETPGAGKSILQVGRVISGVPGDGGITKLDENLGLGKLEVIVIRLSPRKRRHMTPPAQSAPPRTATRRRIRSAGGVSRSR